MCLVFSFFLMKSDSRQVQVKTDAMIYFAKNPRTQETLVDFYARGKRAGWHSGVFSEGDDKSMFLKFNCNGDEQDLKNPCSYVLGLMIL